MGTIVKLGIVQYLRRKKRKSTRTIVQVDELVYFEHMLNVVNGPLILLQILQLLIPAYTQMVFGNLVFCSVWGFFAQFGIIHRAIGGLGIAATRVICICFHSVVVNIGADRLVRYICGLMFTLSFLFAVGLSVELAMLAPEISMSLFQDPRPVPPKARTKFISTAVSPVLDGTACLIFNVVEFVCYVIIFVEMYKQHKRHLRLCLGNKPQLAQQKKRRNTVSAVGHFISWAVEMLIFGSLQYIVRVNRENDKLSLWIFFLLRLFMPTINYVIFPTLQAATSEELRNHIFNLVNWKGMCSHVCRKLGKNGNNVGDQVAQGIELQTLKNGNAHMMNDE